MRCFLLFISLYFPKGGKAGVFGTRATENEIMEEGGKKIKGGRSPLTAAVNKTKSVINDLHTEIIFHTFQGAEGNV